MQVLFRFVPRPMAGLPLCNVPLLLSSGLDVMLFVSKLEAVLHAEIVVY